MANKEHALCEALIRLLEKNLETERSDVTYREFDQSGGPVEMRLRLAYAELKSSRYSEAGLTPVRNRCSRARVHAT